MTRLSHERRPPGPAYILAVMPASPDALPPPAPPADADLSRTYVLVLVVEALVILALYAMGLYFS